MKQNQSAFASFAYRICSACCLLHDICCAVTIIITKEPAIMREYMLMVVVCIVNADYIACLEIMNMQRPMSVAINS